MEPALLAFVLIAASLAAAYLLRRAWSERAKDRGRALTAGWAGVAVILVACAYLIGARGFFIALALLPVTALGLVGSGVRFRPVRASAGAEEATVSPDRDSRMWRGLLRALLAGPVAGFAAITCGLAWATYLPTDPQTRTVTARLLAATLWGAAMAWALADSRIRRVGVALLAIGALAYGAAWLGRGG